MNRLRSMFPGFGTPRPTKTPPPRAGAEPSLSDVLAEMWFGDVCPGAIDEPVAEPLPEPWITPEQAAMALRNGDGAGVRIAVLDSGIDSAHPDIVGRRLSDDSMMDDSDPAGLMDGHSEDDAWHGTAVANVIWDIAPQAEISSFRVLGPKLVGRTGQVWLAAHEAITKGYHIVNCSFACNIPGHLSLYKEWTDKALLAGVHVVAASEGDNTEWPAHFASVLGVNCASGTEFFGGEIFCSSGRMVEFTAAIDDGPKGRDVDDNPLCGSSFAAALMTGIVARLLSVYPIRDPLLVKALLRRVYGAHLDSNN